MAPAAPSPAFVLHEEEEFLDHPSSKQSVQKAVFSVHNTGKRKGAAAAGWAAAGVGGELAAPDE
jgi:hypothetical protein